VTGSITTIAGTCPAIAFTVGGKLVVTNPQTSFSGGQCSGLNVGDVVTATGSTQVDGSMLASQVTKQ